MKTFRLASFNIGASAKMYGRYDETDLFAIADLIKRCGADVVALQEVDRGCARSGGVDMASVIARRAGYRFRHFITIRPFQGGKYGTAILSRFPVTGRKTINYDVRIAKQGTSCGYVTLDTGDGEVTVFNTHLSCESEEANLETMRCLDGILSGYGGELLCCGDFNTLPDVVAGHMHGVRLANTSFCTYEDRGIDNILYTGGFEVTDVSTVDATSEKISDHNMLICTVTVK